MSDFIADPLELISPTLSADTLRRLQGQFDLAHCDARERRAAARSLRERLALSLEVQLYADAIARCRAVRAAKARSTGWRTTRPQPAGVAAEASGAPIAGRPRAVSKGAGVAGAAPPPAMGQGWPASRGAGRAARTAAHPDGQRGSHGAPAGPSANPSFGR